MSMPETLRLTRMSGFTATVSHVEHGPAHVQVGALALGLDGVGEDRCLVLTLRHADGTGLAVHLSDDAMGRLGDLIGTLYGAEVRQVALVTATLQ